MAKINRNRNNQSSNPQAIQQESTMSSTDNQDPSATTEETFTQEPSEQNESMDQSEVQGEETFTQEPSEQAPVEKAPAEVTEPTQLNVSTVEEPVTQAPRVQDNGTQEGNKQPPAPTATIAPVVVNTGNIAIDEPIEPSELEQAFAKIRIIGTVSEKALVNTLEAYVRGMAPGTVIDPDVGARHQYNLWTTLRNVVQSSPDGEFKRLWNIALAFAHQHRSGVFGDRYIFRFSESWRYDTDELDAYQRLINLINLTCNPTEREKGLRNVDLTRTLDKGFNEHGRARLVSFYK